MTATRSVRRSPLSGAQLVGALVAIMAATAVLPPVAAWRLNQVRIERTRQRIDAVYARVGDNLARAIAGGVNGIVYGPGTLPDLTPSIPTVLQSAAHRAWLEGAARAPEVFGDGMADDGWGRCFLVNAGAWAGGGPVWLLSAGPNGLVDTPVDALALAGDDIGTRLR